jgi:hypothetical protein
MLNHVIDIQTEVAPERFEHPTLAFLHQYWKRQRRGRAMPRRTDIHPSEFREHLEWTILVDAPPDLQDFRFRLVGTSVTRYFDREPTGKTVSEAFSALDPVVAKGVSAILRKCAREKVVLRSWGSGEAFRPGYEHFDAIYLPLSDDEEQVNVILLAFVFDRTDMLTKRGVARGLI